MKFLRSIKGSLILSKIKIEEIRDKLGTELLKNKIIEHRQQWTEHFL